jgi:glycosyltransferase involved in cell wall biosynthesis
VRIRFSHLVDTFLPTLCLSPASAGVVELMAAGVLTIAHDSGGPKMDIVVGDVGYLATTAVEYATAMMCAFERGSDITMQQRARNHVKKFSEQAFEQAVCALLPCVIAAD